MTNATGILPKSLTVLTRLFGEMGDALKDVVFPRKCVSCGIFFKPDSNQKQNLRFSGSHPGIFSDEPHIVIFSRVTREFLCQNCAENFTPVTSPLCSRCGKIFKSRDDEDHVCGECISSPKHFRKARAFGTYEQALMTLVHALKYNGKIQLAPALGMMLFKTFSAEWEKYGIDLIIPVPLHIRRLRARGFNQSFLLIRNWIRLAATMAGDTHGLQIEKEVLIRSKWTEPQTGLGRRQRMVNIKHAFCITNPKQIRDKKILLVDDVYTTGATVNECARILLAGGAASVDVLTLARAL